MSRLPRLAARPMSARAAAVALIQRARVPVRRAARSRRAPGVLRTGGARAIAALGRIALTIGRASRRARVEISVLAASLKKNALIQRARVPVGRAAGPRRP